MRRLLLATTNPGKLREIRAVLTGAPVEVLTLAHLPTIEPPEETGATFAENARLKAVYYAQHTGLPTAAEDSGLVVDALDGAPGVHSARYLHPEASYPERFAAIERALAERPEAPRTARFICALAVAEGGAIIFEASGAIEGLIAPRPAGTGGFGYDPIFYYPPYAASLAEVSEADKLRVAHRGQAFRALRAWLIARGSGAT